jgi:hypothetical protein
VSDGANFSRMLSTGTVEASQKLLSAVIEANNQVTAKTNANVHVTAFANGILTATSEL